MAAVGEQRSHGVVFDVQRFCVHDGPGIRTVVFLKGCPLRCAWCCNPESQEPVPEISFESRLCMGCLDCLRACERGALLFEPEHGFRYTKDRCALCGRCAEVCCTGARVMVGRRAPVGDVLTEVLKDVQFFHESEGGGVTLSGGEVLSQWEFARDILKGCRERSVSTAIETSGFGSWHQMEQILEYTDLVYYDLKHMDTTRHRLLTGAGNDVILENCRRVAACAERMIIRYPLIPGLNDEPDNITSMIGFVSSLGTLREIEVLPYHRLGVGKYARLGRRYELNDLHVPTDEQTRSVKSRFESHGFTVRIGG